MSGGEATGLTVRVWRPRFSPYAPTSVYVGEFMPDRYEHAITCGYGFDTMSCSCAASIEEADWWLANACGGHVIVRDEAGISVWEGRVDSVGVSLGGLAITRGPLTETANRCVVTYQLLDTTSNEGGEQKRTNAADNADAQARYGIQYQILSAGAVSTAYAEQIRDAYVALNAWPRTPKDLTLGAGEVGLSLTCKGYAHWLNYPYRLANASGVVAVSAKIAAVLAADPNGFFGGANQIATNALPVQALEDQDRTASEIIADLVGLGDASYNRYLFGIWEERVVRYEAAPMTFTYQQRGDDPRQMVEDTAGNAIQPWAVRPGKWLLFTNLLPGALVAQSLANEPEAERSMFIESVQYSAPNGLRLQGGVVNSLRQALAQWGVTGI